MSHLLPRASSSLLRSPFTPTLRSRSLSTTPFHLNAQKTKVPINLIASLRKEFPVPLAQAREALEKSGLDLKAALEYLKTSSSSSDSAEKKAAKVSGRSTDEGVISISLLGGKRVGMVHLGCETDFVARNQVFLKTAKDISETTAFLDVPSEIDHPVEIDINSKKDPILNFPTESLLSAPLIALPQENSSGESSSHPNPISSSSDPQTIKQSLLSSLTQTGENLKLLRATSFAAPFPSKPEVRFVPSGYAHGGSNDKQGKVGGIVVLGVESIDAEKPMATLIHGPNGEKLETDLNELARTVARQVVGFPTKIVEKQDRPFENDEILYEQPFMMKGDERAVKDVLQEWGTERGVRVRVVGMRRWSVGDELEEAGLDKTE
uniref:Elongation factor Ts, mitochondrial n=1 Tax=Kwoniella bestiolae CBS 10118 TaxID=1296100 RepID=A0A1B9GB90_9TREE|nr:elongation factor Ts, mitochondrial [Kwoniella bestiolae CBS 10118]OCF28269.1 elongation factor Ts, mitochondrial [Kwoniella bestiolae CBS 10118]